MTAQENGLALAGSLSEDCPGLPVVPITGYDAQVQRAMAAGCNVLPKPCTPGTLARNLSRHMAGITPAVTG